MSNRYVEKFFSLTEKNISTKHDVSKFLDIKPHDQAEKVINRPTEDESHSAKWHLLRYTKLLLIPVVGIVYLVCHEHHPTAQLIHPVGKSMLSTSKSDTHLSSVILNYRIASARQILYDISLRKADVVSLSDQGDDELSTTPVMDKVLVVPKSFG